MKYTLNEKFILSEKFILVEDAASRNSTIDTIITKLIPNSYSDAILDKAKANLSKEMDTVSVVQNLAKAYQQYHKVKDAGDINIIKKAINDYLTAFNNYVPEALIEATPTVKAALDKIKSLLNETSTDDTAKANLKTEFEQFEAAASAALQGGGKADIKAVTELMSSLDILKTDLKKLHEFLTKIKTSTVHDETIFNKFEPDLNNLLNSLNSNAGEMKALANNTLTAEAKDINEVITKLSQLSLDVDKFNETYADGKILDKDDQPLLSTKKDWRSLIANEHDLTKKKAIWDEYLKAEWKDHATLIGDLGEAFTQEIEEFGFGSTTNPFIEFLTKLLKLYPKIPLTSSKYGAIHNAYVDGLITTKDLRGTGEFGQNNIIFCMDLYTKAEADIKAYLTNQQKIKLAGIANVTVTFNGNPTLNNTWKQDVQAATMFANSKIDKVADKIDIKQIGSSSSTLRPLTQVSEVVKLIVTDADDMVKANIDEAESAEVVNNLATALGANINTEYNKIISELVYFFIKTSTDLTNIQTFISNTLTTSLDVTNTAPAIASEAPIVALNRKQLYSKALQGYKLDMADIKALIKAIATIAGVSK